MKKLLALMTLVSVSAVFAGDAPKKEEGKAPAAAKAEAKKEEKKAEPAKK